jgi:hypothetical protein
MASAVRGHICLLIPEGDSAAERKRFRIEVLSDRPFKEDNRTSSSPLLFLLPAAPAAIVLISENDDFELSASQSNLARRAT